MKNNLTNYKVYIGGKEHILSKDTYRFLVEDVPNCSTHNVSETVDIKFSNGDVKTIKETDYVKLIRMENRSITEMMTKGKVIDVINQIADASQKSKTSIIKIERIDDKPEDLTKSFTHTKPAPTMDPPTERTHSTKYEPPPKESKGDIWLEVIEDMKARRKMGIEKYGTPLQTNNGRNAVIDAYQEALDLCVYLKQAMLENKSDVIPENKSNLDLINIKLSPYDCHLLLKELEHLQRIANIDDTNTINLFEKISSQLSQIPVKVMHKEKDESLVIHTEPVMIKEHKSHPDCFPKNSDGNYPSYCCQKCGLYIGWVGRFVEKISCGLIHHKCKQEKPLTEGKWKTNKKSFEKSQSPIVPPPHLK